MAAAAATVTVTATATWWRELVELLKGNFVDDGSVVVMRHHEEVIPPLHCTAQPVHHASLSPNTGPLSGPTSTALYVPGLSGGRKMYSNSSRSLCDLVSVAAAAAATLRQFKLLQQLWKSNQLPCYFMPPSCSTQRKMRMGQSKEVQIVYIHQSA